MVPPAGGNTEQPSEQPVPAQDISIAPADMVIYPNEYIAYQKYLDVIRGRPGMADSAVIEATVTSILSGEVCPYQEEACTIEPYPDDWGTVTVDRIIEYLPFGEHGSQPAEAQTGGIQTSEEKTAPGYTGAEGQPGSVKYEPLQPGQEVQTHFLLTARPAKVRRLSTTGSEGMESAQSPGGDAGQLVVHQVGPGDTTFEPIPREGDHFVFSILATDALDSGEIVLPGLTIGSRFRARVQYDGTLYVQEYEPIP